MNWRKWALVTALSAFVTSRMDNRASRWVGRTMTAITARRLDAAVKRRNAVRSVFRRGADED